MIYKIKFNEDYSDFESWEKLDSKYAKPQDYCKEHGDNKFLFVQRKTTPYIVVYHREGNGWARLPWKPKTWIKEYTPWNSMTEEQWIAAVKNFIPELMSNKIKTEEKQKKVQDSIPEQTSAPQEKQDKTAFWEKTKAYGQKCDRISDKDVLSKYFERVKKIYNSAKKQLPEKVVGNMPILWFGDYEKYIKSEIKVVTVGLNPSKEEFPATSNRFPRLSNQNINNITSDEYFAALNEYFQKEPLWNEWFSSYNTKLAPWNAGYRDKDNIALHIDCWSPCATNPVWGKLTAAEQKNLKTIQKNTEKNNDIFIDLVLFLQPDIMLIPHSYWKKFSTPEFEEITEMRNLFQDKIVMDTTNNAWGSLHFYRSDKYFVISGPNRKIPFSNIDTEQTLELFRIFTQKYFNQ